MKKKNTATKKSLLPPSLSFVPIILVILFSLLFYFREIVFSGYTYLPPDYLAPSSFATFLEDAQEAKTFPLWNPYIFCGMPSYGSLMLTGDRIFDLSHVILEKSVSVLTYLFLHVDLAWAFVYYLIMGIGVYLFALYKVKEKLPALIASLATLFSMYVIIWVTVGHGTKILVMAFFPFILLFVERLRERWNLLDMLLLTIVVHFVFIGSHVQMIFYIYLALGIYYLYFLIRELITRSDAWKGTLRSGILLVVASALAFTMVSDKYLSVLEYTPFSIRGADPISATGQELPSERSGGGLDYEYATNWSFSPGEMMTFVVPSWYGFGWHTYQGPLTNNQPARVNTYFGPMPFTDAPEYMGVVILTLAIIGFVRNRKDPFVQFSGILIGVTLLLSFGREFPILYDPMFHYFPYFNKFRAPSMILVLLHFFVPLLAAYGINSFIKDSQNSFTPLRMKRWKTGFGILALLMIIGLLGKGLLTELYSLFFPVQDTVRELAAKYGNTQVANELYNFVANSVVIDILFASTFLLVMLGAFFLYIRKKLSLVVLSIILIGVVLADLWRINTKPIETSTPREQEQIFATPPHVKFLHDDKSLYRVLELENGQPPTSNLLAYWRIQSAHGYHAAKLRAYQDMVDVVGFGNPLLWQLMNIKYIISNQDIDHPLLSNVWSSQNKKVYENRAALPRAFFVNRYEVSSSLTILKNIADMSFSPNDVLYLLEDPNLKIDPPQNGSSASFVHQGIQDFKVDVTATGNNLLFLSEVYYPKGWKAYLDGSEIPILRANYLFRAVVVPPGNHTLEMKFEPEGFYLGKKLSLATNILMLGGFAFVGVRHLCRRSNSKKEAVS